MHYCDVRVIDLFLFYIAFGHETAPSDWAVMELGFIVGFRLVEESTSHTIASRELSLAEERDCCALGI